MSDVEPADEPGLFDGLPPIEGKGPRSAELWLAVGHLRGGHGEAFVSLISSLGIVGVVLGVAVLNCVLAVMTGFEIDLRDKILGANAHVILFRYGGEVEASDEMQATLEAVEGVHHVAPFIYQEMMIRSRFGASGVIVKGVDPHRIAEVPELRDQLTLSLEGMLTTPEAKADLYLHLGEPFAGRGIDADEPLPGIVVGDELAEELQVVPGDKVQVIDPLGGGQGMLGMPTPRVRSFRVKGLFHSGMYEYDMKWTYVALDDARWFTRSDDGVTGYELRVDDIEQVEHIATEVEEAVGYPHFTRHWRSLNRPLFEALRLEKIVMGLILGMIIVVAGLLIVSNLYMLVMTNRRQIAILKAMGASNGTILRIFVGIGLVIGVIGATLGTVLGYLGCRFLAWYEWPLETDVYYLSSLPVVIEWENFVVVAVMAVVVCLMATVYPARRASSLDPVEGLRYE